MPNAKVSFSVQYCARGSENFQIIANFDDVLKACSLALNIHQFSNVPHSVNVISNDGIGESVILNITA